MKTNTPQKSFDYKTVIYQEFSQERREMRKQWNEQLDKPNAIKDWTVYLKAKTMKREFKLTGYKSKEDARKQAAIERKKGYRTRIEKVNGVYSIVVTK